MPQGSCKADAAELQPGPSAAGLGARHLPASTATSQGLACPTQPACLQGLGCISRLHRVALFSGVLLAVEAIDLGTRTGYCTRSKDRGQTMACGCTVRGACGMPLGLLAPAAQLFRDCLTSPPPTNRATLPLASLLSQQPLGASPLPVLGLNGSLR